MNTEATKIPEFNESVVMKYAGDFMHLGDVAQYYDPTVCPEFFALSAQLKFFAGLMPADITAADLHNRLTELRQKVLVAQDRLNAILDAVDTARTQVRKEIQH